jgi:hypothetical protein
VARLGEAGRAVLGEEAVRQLEQDARAVTGIHFATTGAAVIEVHQDGQGLLNNIMGTFTLHLTDETDATGVMFELRVVETLFLGKSGIIHFWCGRK